MKKDLQYYMSLSYPLQIIEIPEAEGGGYMVSIPMLGSDSCLGDGETLDEAFANLKAVKRDLLSRALREGMPIPEPISDEGHDSCSGQFVIRIPKELHRDLRLRAERNGTSLNQYCQYLLARHDMAAEVLAAIDAVRSHVQRVGHEVNVVARRIQESPYHVEEIDIARSREKVTAPKPMRLWENRAA